MRSVRENASGWQAGGVEVLQHQSKTNSRPASGYAQCTDECGKAAAVAAYCWEILSLGAVQRMFLRNPRWRRA